MSGRTPAIAAGTGLFPRGLRRPVALARTVDSSSAATDNTIDITFTGSAGNSFGAFVPKGITLRVYAHVVRESEGRAAEAFGEAMRLAVSKSVSNVPVDGGPGGDSKTA